MSKVYFTNMRCLTGEGLTSKLRRLLKKAEFSNLPLEDSFVAIKMHFGESGNLAFLRPNWAKVVADEVKKCGGKPFLTDCNTLYPGSRKDALEHLETARENGFNETTTGCEVIIADGIKGNDEVEVPVNGKYVENAKIGRAIMDADVFISLTHFKGHEATGFGGALKNIGMGSGSRRGKMEMHNSGKMRVNERECIGCRRCSQGCAHSAQDFSSGKCRIIRDKCVGCGHCLVFCPRNAIKAENENSNELLNSRMMEYAKAVVKDRPCFHISIVTDVSPLCDCYSSNDTPIVPNIGLFCSEDPVALDQACVDKVMAISTMKGSAIEEGCNHDHFTHLHPDTNWKQGLEYAESIGLGKRKYDLIEMK